MGTVSKVTSPALVFTNNELGADSVGDDKVPDPMVEHSNNGMVIRESGPGFCASKGIAGELPWTSVREQGCTRGAKSEVIIPSLAVTSNELGNDGSMMWAVFPSAGEDAVPDMSTCNCDEVTTELTTAAVGAMLTLPVSTGECPSMNKVVADIKTMKSAQNQSGRN